MCVCACVCVCEQNIQIVVGVINKWLVFWRNHLHLTRRRSEHDCIAITKTGCDNNRHYTVTAAAAAADAATTTIRPTTDDDNEAAFYLCGQKRLQHDMLSRQITQCDYGSLHSAFRL